MNIKDIKTFYVGNRPGTAIYIGSTKVWPLVPTSGNAGWTVSLNNEWRLSSTIPNPDDTLYDGVYESYLHKGVGNSADIMYIDIEDFDYFSFYIRSCSENGFDYILVSNLDETIDVNTQEGSSSVKTKGVVNCNTDLNAYQLVEFNNIGGGKHRITVMYRKDNSVDNQDDRGYVLIPKFLPPNNTIYYFSSDNNFISYTSGAFNANVVSHTYDTFGKLVFDSDLTTIGKNAFYNIVSSRNDHITRIILPNTVERIEAGAFEWMVNLKRINIPANLNYIGKDAFYKCVFDRVDTPNVNINAGIQFGFGEEPITKTKLFSNDLLATDVIINTTAKKYTFYGNKSFNNLTVNVTPEDNSLDRLTNLSQLIFGPDVIDTGSNFNYCENLTNINWGNISSISPRSFQYNKYTSIVLPTTVTSLGDMSFFGNSNLETVEIQGQLAEISRPFSSCDKLTTFITDYNTIDGKCLIKNDTLYAVALYGTPVYTIPESIKTINSEAIRNNNIQELFANNIVTLNSSSIWDCDYLNTIHLRDCAYISSGNFDGCNSLIHIYINRINPPTLNANLPNNSDLKVYVPESAVETYKTDEDWMEYADKIVGYNFE